MDLAAIATNVLAIIGAIGTIATTIGSLTVLPERIRAIAKSVGLDIGKLLAQFSKRPPAPPTPPVSIIMIAMLLTGCAGSFEVMRARGMAVRADTATVVHPVDCRAIDSNRILWQGLAEGGAALTAAGGLSTIPADDKDARIALAATAVAAAAFTAIAAKLANDFSEEWVTQCAK